MFLIVITVFFIRSFSFMVNHSQAHIPWSLFLKKIIFNYILQDLQLTFHPINHFTKCNWEATILVFFHKLLIIFICNPISFKGDFKVAKRIFWLSKPFRSLISCSNELHIYSFRRLSLQEEGAQIRCYDEVHTLARSVINCFLCNYLKPD